jgi:hypothetical protein
MLVEGLDFYLEDGLFVLTARYLAQRGYCCGNGCRHCPWTTAADTPDAQQGQPPHGD